MTEKQKKRLSQTTDMAKIMTNIYNNDLLLTSVLNEVGESRIHQSTRHKLGFIRKIGKTQIRELESCFSPEFLSVLKEQLTDENITLQTDGAMDLFLRLDLQSRDFVEGVMNEILHATASGDKAKQAQLRLRIELYYLLHEASEATLNTLLITAKSLVI